MLKSKKIKFIIIGILLTIFVNFEFCYAVDLDLSTDNSLLDNLTLDTSDNTSNQTNASNTVSNDSNTSESNSSESNTSTNQNTNSSYSNTSNSTSIPDASNIVTTMQNNYSEDDLQLTNILNIFLIVIGILLILLAIAILIRLKK